MKAKIKNNLHIIILILIGILSFTLNFYNISIYGYGNEYYAAAIKSMTMNFKNFFFLSFDPSGMVSIDKPPLGFWMQGISVLIFGYKGYAMLLPQALCSTASCIMLYILTSKYFGKKVGLLSSFLFSFTPIVVAVSRNNTIDMELILALLIATWFLFKSIEKDKVKYLFFAAIMVGIGFNIKMLQAYLILPAFVIVYLIFAKGKVINKFARGVIATFIMFAVSFAWVIIVDLYPADQRPYVDSSTNNTVSELILGHNGLERIVGRDGGGMGDGNNGASMRGNDERPDKSNQDNQITPPDMNNGENQKTPPNMNNEQDQNTPPDMNDGNKNDGGGNSQDNIGNASIIRMWIDSIYGQISWFLTFAFISIFAFVKKANFKKLTMKECTFTYWVLYLITMFLFFSFAGFFHRYYLSMLAPGIAVLSSLGIAKMIKELRSKTSMKKYLLLLAFTITMILQIVNIIKYDSLKNWLLPIIIATSIITLILIIVSYFKYSKLGERLTTVFLILSMSIAPFYYALTPVFYKTNTTMPYAGPELVNDNSKELDQNNSSSSLEEYLVENYKEGSYLVVANRSNTVAQFIINTGLPAYAYGGFLGSDNSLSLEELKDMVQKGKITYFLISGDKVGNNSNSEIESYVKENATLIDSSEYSNGSNEINKGDGSGREELYLFQNNN